MIATEWASVRDVPSLYAHYETANLYGKWRQRFISRGYIEKTARTWTRPVDPDHRKEYNRSYYRNWRLSHKAKVKEYVCNYWRRKILREVRSTIEI
jgi:hypothetical protein